jgi:hypothetical protein
MPVVAGVVSRGCLSWWAACRVAAPDEREWSVTTERVITLPLVTILGTLAWQPAALQRLMSSNWG